jgi:hypothetical protein
MYYSNYLWTVQENSDQVWDFCKLTSGHCHSAHWLRDQNVWENKDQTWNFCKLKSGTLQGRKVKENQDQVIVLVCLRGCSGNLLTGFRCAFLKQRPDSLGKSGPGVSANYSMTLGVPFSTGGQTVRENQHQCRNTKAFLGREAVHGQTSNWLWV